MIPTYAIIPSRGRDTLDECIDAIEPQVTAVILVDTSADGLHYPQLEIRRDKHPRNISRWWNDGIIRANRLAWQDHHAKEWNHVVLNDDVIVPAGWVDTMNTALRTGTADLAYPNMWHKITGYAFMLRAETGIRADEDLVWWFGDDDIEYQARQRGGVVAVHAPVDHRYPDHQTQADAELVAQTDLDAKTFVAKWGRMP